MALNPLYAAPEKAKPAAPAPAVPAPVAIKVLTADIAINPPTLSPESTIEIRFPTPMIPKERVGSTEPTSPVVVEPPLTGTFQWTSSRSGQFRLSQTPRFSQSYRFSMRAGLKDLEGTVIASGILDEVTSDQFRIVEQYPKWMDESEDWMILAQGLKLLEKLAKIDPTSKGICKSRVGWALIKSLPPIMAPTSPQMHEIAAIGKRNLAKRL